MPKDIRIRLDSLTKRPDYSSEAFVFAGEAEGCHCWWIEPEGVLAAVTQEGRVVYGEELPLPRRVEFEDFLTDMGVLK